MLTLIWTNLTRNKGRLALTLASVLVAFLLFGLLMAARHVIRPDLAAADQSRLLTANKVMPGAPMPIAYAQRIAQVPGVEAVSYALAIPGWYQNQQNMFGVLAVPGAKSFEIFPERAVAPVQYKTWLSDRTGALVSQGLLNAFGWKVGQHVPIMSSVKKKDGSSTWDFTIDGIVRNSKHPNPKARTMLVHYSYVNAARAGDTDTVGIFYELPVDPGKTTQVGMAIDKIFTNAAPQTSTMTFEASANNYLRQAGDIGGIIIDIAIAVFFAMLLVTGTIMVQTVRERLGEFASLHILGFSRGKLLRMVFGESLLTCLFGGLIGLGLAAALALIFRQVFIHIPASMDVNGTAALIAVGLMIGFGLLTATTPAWQLWRLTVRDVLRGA